LKIQATRRRQLTDRGFTFFTNERYSSRRYALIKFADKGLVVAQYIRNRRLDFCADAIRHAADDEKLAGIGFHWGFSDQSHFSTVFKQRFGMTSG